MTNENDSDINDYWTNLNKIFFKLDAYRQYIKLLIKNYPPAATMFVNRDALLSIEGFDESIPMIEDYPLWLKSNKK